MISSIINSIIVPVWNRFDLTQRFLSQIQPYLTGNDELIIIDNNSTDNTLTGLSLIKKNYDKNLTIISNPENYGFGTANNIGLKIADGVNIIFISNDVEIKGDFIRCFQNELNSDNCCYESIYGARLIEFDTGWNVFKDKNQNKIGPIPYLEGWCIGARHWLFDKICWDENFLCDYEDLSLCYEFKNNGINLKQLNLPLEHNHPGSSFVNVNRLEITLKSQKYFMEKWGLEKYE